MDTIWMALLFIHSGNLCLIIGVFRLIVFNVVIEMSGPNILSAFRSSRLYFSSLFRLHFISSIV